MKKLINIANSYLSKSNRKIINPGFSKVLVVSNTALGDVILSTPAILSLRKSFPDLEITLMVNKNVYSFLNGYECVDKVISFNKGFVGLIRHILFIRKNKINTIFFLHSNGPQDLFIALSSGAENILKAINYPSKVSTEFTNIMLNTIDYKNNKHIIEHRLDLIRCFNPPIVDTNLNLPIRHLNNAPKEKENTIAIQLSAADKYKIWPVENFVKLVHKIDNNTNSNFNIVLLGVASEAHIAIDFENSYKHKNRVENLCGKTTIDELISILQSSKLLITNDTGTLHLSVAVKTPTISLFSPTDPNVFGPYQDLHMHKVVYNNGSFVNNKPKKQRSQDAMSLIKVDDAYRAFVDLKNEGVVCVE